MFSTESDFGVFGIVPVASGLVGNDDDGGVGIWTVGGPWGFEAEGSPLPCKEAGGHPLSLPPPVDEASDTETDEAIGRDAWPVAGRIGGSGGIEAGGPPSAPSGLGASRKK